MSTPIIFSYAEYVGDDNIIPLNSLSAVSEGADTPVSNIDIRERPYRIYRGSGAYTSEAITIDFGAAQQADYVFLDNLNSGITTVQGHANTSSWGSPSFSTSGTATYNYASGRYKVAIALTSFNYRYMRILPGDGSSIDGASTWSIGGMTVFAEAFSWAENTGFPYREKASQASLITVLPGGSVDVNKLGGRYAEITLASALNSSAIDSDMRLFMDKAAGGGLVWFFRNNGDAGEAYLGRRLVEGEFEISSAVTRNFSPIVIREVC